MFFRKSCYAGLDMPWYRVTSVISRPYSLVVSLTLTCECVDVCDMLEFLFDTLLYALTD